MRAPRTPTSTIFTSIDLSIFAAVKSAVFPSFLATIDLTIRPSIFLPPHEMRKLMHGDRAAVRVSGHDHRGRPVGTIVEVLERGKRRIVGRLHQPGDHPVPLAFPEAEYLKGLVVEVE